MFQGRIGATRAGFLNRESNLGFTGGTGHHVYAPGGAARREAAGGERSWGDAVEERQRL